MARKVVISGNLFEAPLSLSLRFLRSVKVGSLCLDVEKVLLIHSYCFQFCLLLLRFQILSVHDSQLHHSS